jgi:hypothetical protein
MRALLKIPILWHANNKFKALLSTDVFNAAVKICGDSRVPGVSECLVVKDVSLKQYRFLSSK